MTNAPKRRFHVAKKIQSAAIALLAEDGLSSLTTQGIAHAAGISPRTFFNYYPYKEAALLGPPLAFDDQAVEEFVAGRNTLMVDVTHLLQGLLKQILDERDQLGRVLRLTETDPKMAVLRHDAQPVRHGPLAEMLALRMPTADAATLDILAAAITAASARAVLDWTRRIQDDLLGTLSRNLRAIPATITLMAAAGR